MPRALAIHPIVYLRVCLAALIAALGCGSDSTGSAPPPSSQPAQVDVVAGDAQRALTGVAVEDSLVVRVTTSAGAAVGGVLVTWSVTGGAGTISPASSQTGADGTARAHWTLGAAAGEQRVTASAAGVVQSATFRATGVELWPVDVHTHLQPSISGLLGAALTFGQTADAAEYFVFMSPPTPADHGMKHDVAQLAHALQNFTSRVVLFGGGGTLNGILHDAAADGEVTSAVRAQFDSTAQALLSEGARGFGEIALTHLSAFNGHPYENVAGDHELLLRLADIAAEHGVPIDVHLDVVTSDRPVPPALRTFPNPEILTENLAAFERLLAHNRGTVFIWGHAGTDLTGQRTVALMRDLLSRHPNLYMSLELGREPPPAVPTSPLDVTGRLRPEWVTLIRDFSDRFMLGSDHFYEDPGTQRNFTPTFAATVELPRQLPIDVALKVGSENAKRILGLQ